jgi:hypothetical protein
MARDASTNHLRTQRWEKGLADIQHATSNDSLIPMFETMVERAFTRSSNPESLEDLPFSEEPAQAPRVKSAAAGSKIHN